MIRASMAIAVIGSLMVAGIVISAEDSREVAGQDPVEVLNRAFAKMLNYPSVRWQRGSRQ